MSYFFIMESTFELFFLLGSKLLSYFFFSCPVADQAVRRAQIQVFRALKGNIFGASEPDLIGLRCDLLG